VDRRPASVTLLTMQNASHAPPPRQLGGQPFPWPEGMSDADKFRALESIVWSLYSAVGRLARVVEDLTDRNGR
jgi:hypothetical protein